MKPFDSESHVIPEGGEARRDITASVSIRHLHLDAAAADQVEALGGKTLSDVVSVLTNPELSTVYRQQLAACSFRLLGCVSGHEVDWLSYYNHQGFKAEGLYFNCSEFKDINANNPVFAIDRHSFGNAGAMLERIGLNTFGLLLDQMRTGVPELPPGFGTKKLAEFWNVLIDLAMENKEKPQTLEKWALRHPVVDLPANDPGETLNDVFIEENSLENSLSPQVKSMNLGVLHLGKKTEMIRNQGLTTVGDVAACPSGKLLGFPNMGKKTVDRIEETIQALANAQLPDGDIDWETYCELMGLALLPSQRLDGTFSETIALLSIVIGETIISGETEDNRIILENRIMKPPSERLTLEAISDLMPVKITRERVRQKEATILERLAASLVYGDYANAPYHFRSEFTAPWRRAADYFPSSEANMSLNELVSGLEMAWGIPREAFEDQLPLITAIITGELASGGEFRQAMPTETNLLSQGSGAALDVPLKHLQIKKAAETHAAEGIRTVGDFLKAAASGELNIEKGAPARITCQQIEFLAQSVDQNGHVDWTNYAWLAEVPIVPERVNFDPKAFLAEIVPTAVVVLEARQLSAIAVDTFRLRTTLPLQDRPTTEVLAERFGTYGPSVKRVETDLLKFLHRVFLEQYLSIARAHVGSEFLAYWVEIDRAFDEANGDAELVKRYLAENWSITTEALDLYMPAIVAIMTGYPLGRLGRYTKIQKFKSLAPKKDGEHEDPATKRLEEFLPQRVVLRGFRQGH